MTPTDAEKIAALRRIVQACDNESSYLHNHPDRLAYRALLADLEAGEQPCPDKEQTHDRFRQAFHDWFMQNLGDSTNWDEWGEHGAPDDLASIATELSDKFAAAAALEAREQGWRPGDPRCDECDWGVLSEWTFCPYCGHYLPQPPAESREEPRCPHGFDRRLSCSECLKENPPTTTS